MWAVYEDGIKIESGFGTFDEGVEFAFKYWRDKYYDVITTPDEVLDNMSTCEILKKIEEEGFHILEDK